MPSYNVNLLGQEVSFKTNAEEGRIKEATKLIEERFDRLNIRGGRLSNEKLLILVALSLADDFIQSNQRLEQVEKRLQRLLDEIDGCGEQIQR